MKIPVRVSILNLAVIALACAAPLAATAAKGTGANANAKPKGVPSFAKKAAAGGMAEVQLGQMAADKATDPDVKAFAQKMVTDHTKANDELKQLASSKGWTLPETIGGKEKGTENRLQKETGPAFDKTYMSAMVADHNADVAMFRSYAKSGSDPDLKAWAEKTLPTLEEHQKMARDTRTKLNSSASAR